MELNKLRKKVASFFIINGFNFRGDDCNYLAENMLKYNCNDNWLNKIIEHLQTTNNLIDRAALDNAIKSLQNAGNDNNEPIFSVINAHEIPKFTENHAEGKPNYLQQRYKLLLQKTQRHELLAPNIIEKVVNDEATHSKFTLIDIEKLLASSHVKAVVIFGYLRQLKLGKYYLCDLTGNVKLNLKAARFHSGFFCEGCFVLAEGHYKDKIFYVNGIEFPPEELGDSSRTFMSGLNTWGGSSKTLLKYSKRLNKIEATRTDATIIFLSDVRIELPEVKKNLRKLFLSYEVGPPVAIVLMGPFTRGSGNMNGTYRYLRQLAELADGCNQLKSETTLVLVPAKNDVFATNILPRPPIPRALASDLFRLWPRTVLATNPCRLQYCTQQISVFRYALMSKFCRNTLHFPADREHWEHHLARTIICQGHLVPLDCNITPIFSDFDAALSLFPLPDLVVIGDAGRAYQTTHHDCVVMNPGSFAKSKFMFKVYFPSRCSVEDGQIPEI